VKKAPQLRLSQIFKYPVAILTIWTEPFALARDLLAPIQQAIGKSLIDESLFSATKEDQEKFSFSIVLPEAELKNVKEGDMIEVEIFALAYRTLHLEVDQSLQFDAIFHRKLAY
jgi:hypothetical protein